MHIFNCICPKLNCSFSTKVKFGFSEKATKFEKIFVVLLTRALFSVGATAYLSKSWRRFFKTNVVKSYYTNFKRLFVCQMVASVFQIQNNSTPNFVNMTDSAQSISNALKSCIIALWVINYSCNKITTTWIQISRQNWNCFFSNTSHQIMI